MKFYDWSSAPNPRRLRLFIAEKGLTIDTEDVFVSARNAPTLASSDSAAPALC